MLKAILSRRDLLDYDSYYSCVKDILSSSEVMELRSFKHHIGVNRFQHSLNVSYYNFRLCKFLHLDARAAARGGLLHDLFFYDWKEHIKSEASHAREHPKIALENASRLFALSEREEDMIYNHMFPLTLRRPHFRETYVITLIDKLCTLTEVISAPFNIIGRKFRALVA